MKRGFLVAGAVLTVLSAFYFFRAIGHHWDSLATTELTTAMWRSMAAALVLYGLTYLVSAMLQPRLENARAETDTAANTLMVNAANALENDVTKHFNRIQELLDALYSIKGTLVKYEVQPGGAVEWIALVPPAYTAGSNAALRGSTPSGPVETDGRVPIKGTQ